MKISIKVVGENSNENSNVVKYGDCINILVNDVTKYVVRFGKINTKNISIEDSYGNQVYTVDIKHPSFIEMFKHGNVYTFSSSENKAVVYNKNHYVKIIEYKDITFVAEKYGTGKYTHYPIFLNNEEIAEGVLLNSSKNFSLDFDIYLLDEFEQYSEALCMLCIYMYRIAFRYLLSANNSFYEKTFNIFGKDNYDPNWLKTNFNIEL